MPTLAFTTCADLPDLEADDLLVVEPLAALGYRVVPWTWDTPGPPPEAAAVVHRSCWDYHLRADTFRTWATTLPIPSLNGPATVRWNLDKSYLRDLAERRVPIPTTVWVDKPTDLRALLEAHDLDEVVIKPQISLSAFETFRASRARAAQLQGRFDAAVGARPMMVQAFLPEITGDGERSLVFFAGRFSHAVRKVPREGDFRVQGEHGGRHEAFPPDSRLVAEAERILTLAPEPTVYARVDLVLSGGRPVLMELELIDPALFLATDPSAAARFAGAIADALAR